MNAHAALVADSPEGTATGLSNDYLNHYGEAVMLLDMALMDRLMFIEMVDWRPLSYIEYFALSPLRRARSAIAAYEALLLEQQRGFEALMNLTDRLVLSAISLLQSERADEEVLHLVQNITHHVRRLMEQASVFLNNKGHVPMLSATVGEAQAIVDGLM
jgi:hypothetical protein